MSCGCASKTCQHPLSVSKSYVDAVVLDLQNQFDAAGITPTQSVLEVVANVAALPPSPADGSVRLVADQNSLYAYLTSWGAWRRIGRPSVHYSNTTPSLGMVGDLWVDSDLVVRGIHDGAFWRTVTGASSGGGTSGESVYGEHVVTWSGTSWIYRGSAIVSRPTIPSYYQGAYVVWDTSLDVDASPPHLAVPGDKWHPHPDAVV